VAVSDTTGAQAQRLHRHHRIAVQGHEAVRRAHEMHARPAVGQLIAHDLGDRQPGQRLVQRLLQSLGQAGAGQAAVEVQRLRLAVGLTAQLRQRRVGRAEGSQLLLQRRRRLTGSIQRHGRRHQLVLQLTVGGLRCNALHMHGQPSRRGIGADRRIGRGQALRLQCVGEQRGKGLAELLQGLRRQLLDEQLDQQVVVAHGAQAAFFASCALTSSAHSRGAIGKPSRARLSR
jgi:hypothetical protein